LEFQNEKLFKLKEFYFILKIINSGINFKFFSSNCMILSIKNFKIILVKPYKNSFE